MGAVIGGALGGLVLIIFIALIIIFVARALYKFYLVSVKYTEVYCCCYKFIVVSYIFKHTYRELDIMIIHCMMSPHLLT